VIPGQPAGDSGDYSDAMTESRAETEPTSSSRCPWCSSPVAAESTTCPACGAKLRDEADADIPGVTHIDPAATVVRAAPRGRGLIGWLSGDYETNESDVDRASVELPSDAVKQEMFRLEMEALRAELDAEAAEREAADREAARAAFLPATPVEPGEPGAPGGDEPAARDEAAGS
jgi:hypothetical protein